MRQPRLAEMVAGALRDRIVDGELADGDALPGLDGLVKEFRVSRPSLREALRILENEGLITVRRGNVGGAVVHRPTPDAAAYTFGLVLQAEQVPVADLARALGHLEGVCARLCAERRDRRREVVPELRRLHKRSESCIEDPLAFEQACQNFHDGLVAKCGNQSIALAVNAFGGLWRRQREGWAQRVLMHEYPDPELRRSGLDAHARILAAIADGDPEKAEALTLEHIQHPRVRQVKGAQNPVRATQMIRRA